MKKVITYGTFDLLHYGHIRLLERARSLGDYLIVGVTSDSFDENRGKINVRQSVMERIQAVRDTGLADQIIIEEYEGQKIDDIRRYNADIFAIGSDWRGKFDYLNDYCEVVYLDRTEGISSTAIRSGIHLKLGVIGDNAYINKVSRECRHVNGLDVSAVLTRNMDILDPEQMKDVLITEDLDALLDASDCVFVRSHPSLHYEHAKRALMRKKHVLCEAPAALKREQTKELRKLAEENQCIFMEGLKTAYATAFSRLVLLAKSGTIGDVISVEARCTSLREVDEIEQWSSLTEWGPTGLLPVFRILGTEYRSVSIVTKKSEKDERFDLFTQLHFVYDHAAADVRVGMGVKSEGDLVISGTNGYIYVPAPWWKTDYFEIRHEDIRDNRRYFFQLEGEGIRKELHAFAESVENQRPFSNIEANVTDAVAGIMEEYYDRKNYTEI